MNLSAAIVLGALTAGSLGCDRVPPSTCDRSEEGNPEVRYTEGTVEDGVYMSSPWNGELLYFPGGMRYAIEHKLGDPPRWIEAYLSFERFEPDGGPDGGRRTLASAAGNQAVLLDVNATTLTLANDSCVDYWLLVTAGAGDRTGP
jgi:hypothetical protein